ncbi:hypothetical protein MKW92_028658, partial [Papaver armeniacum]
GDGEIEVPTLIKVSWLHVVGKMDMSKLNPGVNYEVVFVVMLGETLCLTEYQMPTEWNFQWATP